MHHLFYLCFFAERGLFSVLLHIYAYLKQSTRPAAPLIREFAVRNLHKSMLPNALVQQRWSMLALWHFVMIYGVNKIHQNGKTIPDNEKYPHSQPYIQIREEKFNFSTVCMNLFQKKSIDSLAEVKLQEC